MFQTTNQINDGKSIINHPLKCSKPPTSNRANWRSNCKSGGNAACVAPLLLFRTFPLWPWVNGWKESWVKMLKELLRIPHPWRCCVFSPPARSGSPDFITELLPPRPFPLLLFSSCPRPSAPQLRAPGVSGHCRTWARRQRECQIECQKERQNRCHIECQKECQNRCQMTWQKECLNRCQVECQNRCQIKYKKHVRILYARKYVRVDAR